MSNDNFELHNNEINFSWMLYNDKVEISFFKKFFMSKLLYANVINNPSLLLVINNPSLLAKYFIDFLPNVDDSSGEIGILKFMDVLFFAIAESIRFENKDIQNFLEKFICELGNSLKFTISYGKIVTFYGT